MTGRLVILWLHPVVGVVTVGVMLRAARLGVDSRRGGAVAARARVDHARLGPWLLALAVVGWMGGLVSTWWGRDDLDLFASGHCLVGGMIVGLLGVAALLSRWMDSNRAARWVHPWLGAAAVLLSGVQVFLGLQIMPR